MEKSDAATAVAFIATFVIMFAGIGGLVNVWLTDCYDVDQAVEWNWRARASNDLGEMANYLEEALGKLDRFEGNPKWFRPTPDTDWDLIKGNIQENIDVAREVEEIADKDDMSYQFEVQNIQETIVEINEHIRCAEWWIIYTQTALWMGVIFFLSGLILLILSLLAWPDTDAELFTIIAMIWSLAVIIAGAVVSMLWLAA